jgi:hypothetical protein
MIEDPHNVYFSRNIGAIISGRMRWAGYVAHMEGMRNENTNILLRNSGEGERTWKTEG